MLKQARGLRQEGNGSTAAQWQFTYLTNGAYRIANIKRGLDKCDQTVLSSLPSGRSELELLEPDNRCAQALIKHW